MPAGNQSPMPFFSIQLFYFLNGKFRSLSNLLAGQFSDKKQTLSCFKRSFSCLFIKFSCFYIFFLKVRYDTCVFLEINPIFRKNRTNSGKNRIIWSAYGIFIMSRIQQYLWRFQFFPCILYPIRYQIIQFFFPPLQYFYNKEVFPCIVQIRHMESP
mgnify:CR=1 FL=1